MSHAEGLIRSYPYRRGACSRQSGLCFWADHYMFIELRDKLEHVTQFCCDHFYKLKAFHAQAGGQS